MARPVSGLITVPGAIALLIWLSAAPMLWADRVLETSIVTLFGFASDLSVETARSVLATIATAAITTLSLVYSLVLVVFTLAAGNIAPRLLKRFTGDRVNQVTAGLLGGTFLFALTVQYHTGPDSVPLLSIAAAMALSVIFVLQLIYFVHSVSRSVTIDEEIAAISDRLESRIATMVRDEKEREGERTAPPSFPFSVTGDRSGYLNAVDEDALLRLACEEGLSIRLRFKPGDFILESQPVAHVSREPAVTEQFARTLRECLLILPSREDADDVGYSISLLIEIALRALSPGVNDTFTAIASLDRLTAAFSAPVRLGLRQRDIVDEDAAVRVEMPGLGLEDMLDTTFHPLRRAAVGNMLMLEHLARALARLEEIGDRQARELIKVHASLLLDSARTSGPLNADYDALQQLMPFIKQGE